MSMSDDQLPPCPECASDLTYESGGFLTCPMCAHEWTADAEDADAEPVTRDAVGNPLVDGDTVTIVKSLKVKGSGGGSLKIGTKVSGIRMIPDSGDGHDIEAKVAGFGEILLKSSVVKKA
ncbi:zinc ribbon domain-containing protein YjdM [Janibacter sp. Soil728]|uniref:zinc ribbon domain-containing protein YjdM n=1 Tax=Janibacter sp. Soil728 TaxID=1736393 RepID=UPI0009E86BBA|nr:zinc ribbon domain-containing protein YjdM [Janibacter sp. Soil728]